MPLPARRSTTREIKRRSSRSSPSSCPHVFNAFETIILGYLSLIMQNLNVIIVGAGIGGLQSALALSHDAHRVTILESAKAFEEVRMPAVFSPLRSAS